MTGTERTLPDERPFYEHDCVRCTFLGNKNGMDLYHCLQGMHGIPTVIARRSSDDYDYKSGIFFCESDPELAEALRRAKDRGLRCE